MDTTIEICTCDRLDGKDDVTSNSTPPEKTCRDQQQQQQLTKRPRISLTSFAFNLRRGRSFQQKAKRGKKNPPAGEASNSGGGESSALKKSASKWPLKLYCGKKETKEDAGVDKRSCCKCSCLKRVESRSEATVPATSCPAEDAADAREVVEKPPENACDEETNVAAEAADVRSADEREGADIYEDVEESVRVVVTTPVMRW